MPETTERTEYRLLHASSLPAIYRRETSDRALNAAGLRLAHQRGIPSRIQTRTVTETPWVDLDEGEGKP